MKFCCSFPISMYERDNAILEEGKTAIIVVMIIKLNEIFVETKDYLKKKIYASASDWTLQYSCLWFLVEVLYN